MLYMQAMGLKISCRSDWACELSEVYESLARRVEYSGLIDIPSHLRREVELKCTFGAALIAPSRTN